jgi:hypothetical protein
VRWKREGRRSGRDGGALEEGGVLGTDGGEDVKESVSLNDVLRAGFSGLGLESGT